MYSFQYARTLLWHTYITYSCSIQQSINTVVRSVDLSIENVEANGQYNGSSLLGPSPTELWDAWWQKVRGDQRSASDWPYSPSVMCAVGTLLSAVPTNLFALLHTCTVQSILIHLLYVYGHVRYLMLVLLLLLVELCPLFLALWLNFTGNFMKTWFLGPESYTPCVVLLILYI